MGSTELALLTLLVAGTVMLVYINGRWCYQAAPFPPSNITWIFEKNGKTGKITVRWVLSPSKDIQYQQVKIAVNKCWLPLANSGRVDRRTTGYYVPGLKPGDMFYFEIYAVNNAGIRSSYEILNIYIPPFPDTEPPKPVKGLTHRVSVVSL